MPKRKFPSKVGKKPHANTIRDCRLAIRNSISQHKNCPYCGLSTLQVTGTFTNRNKVWAYCIQCNLNKDGDETHTFSHLTGWEDVYCTIVDANIENDSDA